MGGMTGSSSQGSSSTTSTQPYIMSGPSQQAASLAAQAQINAAKIAAEAATQNTQSAIGALMNQYGTALTYANPSINTGNQANAQINYMLGLPAASPGPSPTSPTLDSYINPIKPSQVKQYIAENLSYGDVTAQGNHYDATNYLADPVTGFMHTNTSSNNSLGPNVEGANQFANTQGGNPGGNLYAHIEQTLLDEEKKDQQSPNSPYNQALQTYQQQLNQYNQQQDVYNAYKAKGIATPETISNIVTNLPGFQFEQKQGINAIQNAASASGMLNSGNLLQGLDEFGQGISQKYYQNYLSNLSGLADRGQSSTLATQQGANTLGANLAGAYTNLGNTKANAALAAGQAMASSYLLPVANQSVSMTPYTTSSQTSSNSSSQGSGLSSIGQGLGLLQGLGGMFG